MNLKKLLFGIFFLLAIGCPLLKAQKAPMKWGELLPEDIKMNVYSPDPGAPAVVLCEYGTAWVGPYVQYTKHVRIKILKDAGLAYAKVEIPYRSYDHFDHFSDLKAETFNVAPNGSIVKTRLKAANIDDQSIDERHRKKVFTFPDAKAGSIIEYTYTLNSLDLAELNNWYFQEAIPVIWSEYRINIPRKFNYLVTFQQGKQLDVSEQQAYADRLQWLYNTPITKVYPQIMGNNNVLYESPEKTVKVYLAGGQSLRFVMDHVPASTALSSNSGVYPDVKASLYLAEGPFPFYFRVSMAALNQDYDTWDRWQWRFNWWPGYEFYLLPTWEEANKNWLDNEYLGLRLSRGFKSKPILDAIAHTDSVNLLKGIFGFVQQNVKWNGTYSIYAEHSFKSVLRRKSGSGGEINLLLISLLRKAGFSVSPVLIRTSELGRIENMYPEKGQFNHVIARVELHGGAVYLDATSGSVSELPQNVRNTIGWLLQPQGYGWVTVDNNFQKKRQPQGYPQA